VRGSAPGVGAAGGEAFYQALYKAELGELYLQRNRPGDAERAQGLLGEALSTFSAVRARRFEDRVTALLSHQGAPS